MSLYERWCDATREKDKRKYYWTYVEKHGGRDEIQGDLAETIRSHYDRLERIAEDVDRLGYKVAAEIARVATPEDVGEWIEKGKELRLSELRAEARGEDPRERVVLDLLQEQADQRALDYLKQAQSIIKANLPPGTQIPYLTQSESELSYFGCCKVYVLLDASAFHL